jgi:hypothetical protein
VSHPETDEILKVCCKRFNKALLPKLRDDIDFILDVFIFFFDLEYEISDYKHDCEINAKEYKFHLSKKRTITDTRNVFIEEGLEIKKEVIKRIARASKLFKSKFSRANIAQIDRYRIGFTINP